MQPRKPGFAPLIPNWDARGVAPAGGANFVSGMAAADAAVAQAEALAGFYRRQKMPAGTVIYDGAGRVLYRRDL